MNVCQLAYSIVYCIETTLSIDVFNQFFKCMIRFVEMLAFVFGISN